MWRIALILASAGIVISAVCQDSPLGPGESRDMAAPALPHYDWKACPFEGCVYREWTTRKSVVVYDTWEEKRQPVSRLSVGEKVVGVTGVFITFRPGVIRMDRDLPEAGLLRGDTLLTYLCCSEGFASVWFKGRYYSEFDISFTKWPDGTGCGGAHCAATYADLGRKSWWAEVRLQSGRTAWVEMDQAEFDGVNALA